MMEPTTSRRTGALLASAALLVSLTVATVAAPASAAPTCDGKAATITDNDGNDLDPRAGYIKGTPDADVIVAWAGVQRIKGKGGDDTICAGTGNDVIHGGAGNDRIFGGGGGDHIEGGLGHDDIFGWKGRDGISGGPGNDFIKGGGDIDYISGQEGDDIIKGGGGGDAIFGNRGNDKLRGQAGPDTLDGGVGSDDCNRGPGGRYVSNCETTDLKVKVIAPPSPANADGAPFKVRVRNLGQQASSYTLVVDEENMHATCNPPWEGVEKTFRKLGPGATRTHTYTVVCTDLGANPWVEVEATVKAHAKDPTSGNDTGASRRVALQ